MPHSHRVSCSCIFAAGLSILLCQDGSAQFRNFVTARGDKLMDGKEELRFISCNIPNLHYIEDNLAFTQSNPWRVADEFEIRDALTSIKQMGGQVTRMYVPSVRKEIDDSTIVRHVLGPGQFNEEAFRGYDRVLQVANETGVRMIIPLVDNWWWWGGPRDYARFRGKKKEDFWTDSLIVADFKKTIAFLINRVNSYTGIPFKEDKAILGWETGNEMEAPFSWTREIASYIKSLDTNHLVIEGTHSKEIIDEVLLEPTIDVLSTHHYTPVDETIARITKARERARNRKPYFVGEFGFMPTADMRRVLDTVISTGISGIMIWSLRGHNRDGGFYSHSIVYRWPGFESGRMWDEAAVMSMFREKAYQINGRTPEPLPAPETPRLLPVETPWKISWQGSTGASAYMLERKSEDDLLWQVVAAKASDAEIAYRPLYMDTTAQSGKRYFYRVRARNASGYSEPSEPVGPVTVEYLMLIDELENDSKFFGKSAGIRFLTPRDMGRAKEDRSRVAGDPGDYIVYKLPGRIRSMEIDLFSTRTDADTSMRLSSGTTADSMAVLSFARQVFEPLGNEYKYYTDVSLSATDIPPGHRIVKIALAADCQIGRVEIQYLEEPR
jgi:mannan endo-1,4-beta-mannosidase